MAHGLTFVWSAKRENSLNLWGPRINITLRTYILHVSITVRLSMSKRQIFICEICQAAENAKFITTSCALTETGGAFLHLHCLGGGGVGGCSNMGENNFGIEQNLPHKYMKFNCLACFSFWNMQLFSNLQHPRTRKRERDLGKVRDFL